MFKIIGIPLEYQPTYVIRFYCWSYIFNKKTRDKKKDVCLMSKS